MNLKKLILFTLLLLLTAACGSDDENSSHEKPQPSNTSAEEAPPIIETLINYEAANPIYSNDLTEFIPSITPTGLHNTGGNTLMDSDFNYKIQFPTEWHFWSSTEVFAQSEYRWGMTFEERAKINPHFAQVHFSALVSKSWQLGDEREHTEMGNPILEPVVGILYWPFPEGYTIHEIAWREVHHFNNIHESLAEHNNLNKSSFVEEPRQVNINGVTAYRYMRRMDIRTGYVHREGDIEDFAEVRYIYLIPLTDSVYARFDLGMADANLEVDAEIIEKFRTAMEGLTWAR